MSLQMNFSWPRTFFAQHPKEPQQCLGRPIFADPQQSLRALVDLIDQRQVLVASLPLHFVHANRRDARQVAMGQAPRNRVFYRAKHVLPGRAERLGHSLPGEPLGPARQEPAVRRGQASACRRTRELARPVRRTSDSRPVAWHTRSTPRSATAARTRTAARPAGRSRGPLGRSPSRSPGRWPAVRSESRSSSWSRDRPIALLGKRTTCAARRD